MEFTRKNVTLAYADNIAILRDTENELVKETEKLILSSHRMNLNIEEEKIKYPIMTRRSVNKTPLKVGSNSLNKCMHLNTLESI